MKLHPGAILACNAALPLAFGVLQGIDSTASPYPAALAAITALVLGMVPAVFVWSSVQVARTAGAGWVRAAAVHGAAGQVVVACLVAADASRQVHTCVVDGSLTTHCVPALAGMRLLAILGGVAIGLAVAASAAVMIGGWARAVLGVRDPRPVLTLRVGAPRSG